MTDYLPLNGTGRRAADQNNDDAVQRFLAFYGLAPWPASPVPIQPKAPQPSIARPSAAPSRFQLSPGLMEPQQQSGMMQPGSAQQMRMPPMAAGRPGGMGMQAIQHFTPNAPQAPGARMFTRAKSY